MNKFKEHFKSMSSDEREALAKQGKTSVAYLSQVARGHSKPGADLIDRLIEAGRKDIAILLRPKWFEENTDAISHNKL